MRFCTVVAYGITLMIMRLLNVVPLYLWCFVRGHYQIRGCPNINLRTVNRISFFRCWNVLLIKAIISTCFDTMDGFMYLAIT